MCGVLSGDGGGVESGMLVWRGDGSEWGDEFGGGSVVCRVRGIGGRCGGAGRGAVLGGSLAG